VSFALRESWLWPKAAGEAAVSFALRESWLWPKAAGVSRAFGLATSFFEKLQLLKAKPKGALISPN
jgi:hypothetical protein